MEQMPYPSGFDLGPTPPPMMDGVTTTDWRRALPVLGGNRVVLRELRRSDAPSLFAMLTSDEVSRFISPPPTTIAGFEQFIAWTHRMRASGAYVCFAVTVPGDVAIGIFQVRRLDEAWTTAEWGFAIGSPFWGSGIFADGAELVLRFAFETVGIHRLEARASLNNGRGNAALRKMGAVEEGVLRHSFHRDGHYHDQALWTILEEDWRASRASLALTRAMLH